MFDKCMGVLFWPSIFAVIVCAGLIGFFHGSVAGITLLTAGSISVFGMWFALHWLCIPAVDESLAKTLCETAQVVETDSGMLVKVDEGKELS